MCDRSTVPSVSSISRVLRSKLKQPDGPGEDMKDTEIKDNNPGNNPGGQDSSKHSIDDILATSPSKDVESEEEGENFLKVFN